MPAISSKIRDGNGWAPVHLAAFRGQVKTVDRLVHTDPSKLELRTDDDVGSTPLLLAVLGGRLEAIRWFVNMGADVLAKNSRGQGVIELTVLGRVRGESQETTHSEDEHVSENEREAEKFKNSGTEGPSNNSNGVTKVNGGLKSSHGDLRPQEDMASMFVEAQRAALENLELEVMDIGHGRTVEMLHYFENLSHEGLRLWFIFGQLIESVTDEELETVTQSILLYLDRSHDDIQHCRHQVAISGFIKSLINSLRKTSSAFAKIKLLTIWSRLMFKPELIDESIIARIEGHSRQDIEAAINTVRKLGIQADMVSVLVEQISTIQSFILTQCADDSERVSDIPEACNEIQLLAATALCELYTNDQSLVASPSSHTALSIMGAMISYPFDSECLTATVDAISSIICAGRAFQDEFGSNPNRLRYLADLYPNCDCKDLQTAVTKAIIHSVTHHAENQTVLLEYQLETQLVDLLSNRSKELQNLAIEALYRLTEEREDSSRLKSAPSALIEAISRNPMPSVQVMAARTLWRIFQNDFEQKLWAAAQLGRRRIVEFLSAVSEDLQEIGCEALEVLLRGPPSVEASVPQPPLLVPHGDVLALVALLRSSKINIVLSALKALRWMLVGIGYTKRSVTQKVLFSTQGLKLLAALTVHAEDLIVQTEAALTLAGACLGQKSAVQILFQETDFSFRTVIRLLRSELPEVKIPAGEALSLFSFNNEGNAAEISRQKSGGERGLKYDDFQSLLRCDDELIRSQAAFQIVVLAPIFTDQDSTSTTATGIKILVDLLGRAEHESTKALTADLIARLAHSRLGIPEAIVSINGVNHLCNLLSSQYSRVRYNSAVALGFLSATPQARRQIFARCRKDPRLMNVLEENTTHGEKISHHVFDDWKHFLKNFAQLK